MSSSSDNGHVLGIDIGGTGIKGGVVDLTTGQLVADRYRLKTPPGAHPDDVATTIAEVVQHFDYSGEIGVAFPGVVQHGVARTSANLDKAWIDTSLAEVLEPHLPGPGTFVNDADAAGLAEDRFGAGRDRDGLVVLVTFGTGIGTALIYDGHLVPNSELGHIEIDGGDAEKTASISAMERADLSWKQWANRASKYLKHLENLLWPELIIIGGGLTKESENWLDLLKCRTPLAVAALGNSAGIVGAALNTAPHRSTT
jgi:polyphosphate glucokinase